MQCAQGYLCEDCAHARHARVCLCVRVRLCGVFLCGYGEGVLGLACGRSPGPPVQVLVRRRATLPHPAGCSTIAVPGLSFQVRNGTGRLPRAMAAARLSVMTPRRACGVWSPVVRGPDRDASGLLPRLVLRSPVTRGDCRRQGLQEGAVPRAWGRSFMRSTVSTGPLHPSRGFHVRPIDLVFYKGSHGAPRAPRNPNLGGGFPLRCFQRLSQPNVANRPCRWRDNRHTRGSSTQVLSYYGQGSPGFQRAQRIETKLSHDVLNPARVPL